MAPDLSILVASIPSRLVDSDQATRLLRHLVEQTMPHGERVEVLVFFDDKKRSVGAKRNGLLTLSTGRYIVFIDDDDWVVDDYVDIILQAIDDNPQADVICYPQYVSINGGPKKKCLYSVRYAYVDGPDLWTGKPAHTMVWRGDIARSEKFPEKNFGEDHAWVQRVCAQVKLEARLEVEPLYLYAFDSRTTETRDNRR